MLQEPPGRAQSCDANHSRQQDLYRGVAIPHDVATHCEWTAANAHTCDRRDGATVTAEVPPLAQALKPVIVLDTKGERFPSELIPMRHSRVVCGEQEIDADPDDAIDLTRESMSLADRARGQRARTD